MKDVRILCRSVGEFLAVMSCIETNDSKVHWNAGQVPTDYGIDFTVTKLPLMIIISNNIITWDQFWSDEETHVNQVSGAVFLRDYKLYFNKNDLVNHPAHYTSGKVECIDAMKEALGAEIVKGFCLGNTFKYLWRRKDKGAEEQDVQKALWYFDRYKKEISE